MNGVGAAEGFSRALTQSEVADLALFDKLGQDTDGVFNGTVDVGSGNLGFRSNDIYHYVSHIPTYADP